MTVGLRAALFVAFCSTADASDDASYVVGVSQAVDDGTSVVGGGVGSTFPFDLVIFRLSKTPKKEAPLSESRSQPIDTFSF